MDKFWMVYVEGGLASICKHYTKDLAEAEAEKLSKKFPGVQVYILETTEFCVSGITPIRWFGINMEAKNESRGLS